MLHLEGVILPLWLTEMSNQTDYPEWLRVASHASPVIAHTCEPSLRPSRLCSRNNLLPTSVAPNSGGLIARSGQTTVSPTCLSDSPSHSIRHIWAEGTAQDACGPVVHSAPVLRAGPSIGTADRFAAACTPPPHRARSDTYTWDRTLRGICTRMLNVLIS
jgi:hypothetical protein